MAEQYRRSGSAVYGRLAYDLDAIVLERQLEEAGAMPERKRAEEPAPRRRSEAHTKAQPHLRPSPLLSVSVVIVCALVAVLLLGYVQLTAVGASISRLNNEITALETEHVALLTEYEKTFDLATIKATAEAAGMSKPTSGQA